MMRCMVAKCLVKQRVSSELFALRFVLERQWRFVYSSNLEQRVGLFILALEGI